MTGSSNTRGASSERTDGSPRGQIRSDTSNRRRLSIGARLHCIPVVGRAVLLLETLLVVLLVLAVGDFAGEWTDRLMILDYEGTVNCPVCEDIQRTRSDQRTRTSRPDCFGSRSEGSRPGVPVTATGAVMLHDAGGRTRKVPAPLPPAKCGVQLALRVSSLSQSHRAAEMQQNM